MSSRVISTVSSTNRRRIKTLLITYGIPSLLVVLFFWQYAFTGQKVLGGDFDYYLQMNEAARISVEQYGQFPAWNPWMSGGIPLFANPQFGLFTVHMGLVLLFGTVIGMKIGYIIYALAGFWGMFFLGTKVFKASTLKSLLVGFIWIANGFFAGHNMMHYTFAMFFLLPWILLLIHQRHSIKKSWLYLGLLFGLISLNSVHYAFLMMALTSLCYFLIVGLINLYANRNNIKNTLLHEGLFALKSLGVFFVIAGYRLYESLLYMTNNTRAMNTGELQPSLGLLARSIFEPIGTLLPIPNGLPWGWWEYSMYIGIGAGLALAVVLITHAVKIVKNHYRTVEWSNPLGLIIPILILGFIGLLFAWGDHGPLSPYALLHHIPGFSQTRVPSRWLFFTMFAVLATILWSRWGNRVIQLLLILACAELFIAYGPLSQRGQDMFMPGSANYNSTFAQYDNDRQRSNVSNTIHDSYYTSTTNNIGQIYTDDPVINTYDQVYLSRRCGENKDPNCKLVLTNNATVVYWSPNKIVLQRLSSGEISLNMNPSSHWLVNSKPATSSQRIDPNTTFTIDDDSSLITLQYAL